jgi:hypothetical protein
VINLKTRSYTFISIKHFWAARLYFFGKVNFDGLDRVIFVYRRKEGIFVKSLNLHNLETSIYRLNYDDPKTLISV